MKIRFPQSCLSQVVVAASIAIGSVAAAQPAPTHIRPGKPPEITEAEPAIKAAADALFRQAGEAFKSAKAVTCKSTVKVTSGPNENTVVVESQFGPDGTMKIEGLESLIVVKDGYINIVLFSVHDRYIRVPVSQMPSDNVLTLFGERSLAGFEVLMREGQPPDVWLEPLMMRSMGQPKVTGLETVTSADGTPIQRILVAGHMGSGSIDYDPEKKTFVAARSEMYPIDGVEGFTWEMTLTPEITFLEALPEPITFDPGRRTPVTTRQALDPIVRNRLAKGMVAPTLRLPQLDGTVVDLAELRGKIVVLDFWATWCGPCKRGLPKLNQFYVEQGRNSGQVKVYAVDVMERASDPAERMDLVSQYWRQQKFEMPTLISPDDKTQVAWGVTSIPLTVVISPEGKIVDILSGYSENMKMKLEAIVKKLGDT